MKPTIKSLICSFIMFCIIFWFLFFSIFCAFCEFKLLEKTNLYKLSSFVAILLAVVCVVVEAVLFTLQKKTKFGNWLSNNVAKMMTAYSLVVLFCFSVKSTLTMDINDMREIVSLGWTIFGISAAAFLIWNCVAIDYLESKKPTKPMSDLPTKEWKYINEKGQFYNDATILLTNINLLLVDLVFLSFATVYIYISSRKGTVFAQFIAVLSLYLSANTIVGLFIDVLKPFNEKKKRMLDETKVSSADVVLQNRIQKQSEILLKTIEVIEGMEDIDEKTRSNIIAEAINSYKKQFEIDSETQK